MLFHLFFTTSLKLFYKIIQKTYIKELFPLKIYFWIILYQLDRELPLFKAGKSVSDDILFRYTISNEITL